MVNYNTAHSKTAYKYLLKDKKKYDLQIWQHNICHTNIIAIKNMIIEEKIKRKKGLLKDIRDITTLAEVA